MPDTVINSKIYKKTGTNTYVLYHPETGAEQVIYSYTSLSSVANVKQALDAIFSEIDAISGVLEFKGNSTVGTLPTDNNRKGEVYVVQYPTTGSDHHIYWSPNSDGPWEEYPTNTLFVCSGDTTKNYIKDETTTAAKAGWIPLGGTNSAYATKTEAIHTIIGDNTGLKFGYASEANATHSVEGVSTIGTTAVSTTTIVSTIPDTGSDSSIPNVAAVRAFAGSADNVIVTTTSASSDYYITFVESTGSTGQPLYVNSGLFYDPSTNELNVIASEATTAGTADQVANALGIFGQSYNGSVAKTISKGNGLTIATSGNTTTVSVGEGNGIIVNANNVAINKGAGLIFNSDDQLMVNVNTSGTIKVAGDGIGLTTTGITGGTYSALQVDEYGRAKAGAQSIVFAENSSDPDLNSLVVGGLAFIGTATTYSDSADTTHSIPDGTNPKIG